MKRTLLELRYGRGENSRSQEGELRPNRWLKFVLGGSPAPTLTTQNVEPKELGAEAASNPAQLLLANGPGLVVPKENLSCSWDHSGYLLTELLEFSSSI